MKHLPIAILSLIVLVLFVKVFFFTDKGPTTEESVYHYEEKNDSIPALKIRLDYFKFSTPKKANFCGENVPMSRWDIKERLERELVINTYYHSNTIFTIKRANRWFPMIEAELKKNKIPEDFKYLAIIESGLDNVVSPAGASGFWQFMEGTGKEYDLKVTKHIDERFNPQKSTEAACKYLLDSYAKFKNWTLVAASYNRGMKGVKEAMEDQQEEDFYDLYLNSETYRYVFRILAIKEIFENPKKYHFEIDKEELYEPIETKSIKITKSPLKLVDLAKKYNTTYKMLRILNPEIRNENPQFKGDFYMLKIPN